MPLDPQVKAFLDQTREAGFPAFNELPVPDARLAYLAFATPPPEGGALAVENRRIAGPAGEMAIRVYTPAGRRPQPVLVYFHGGGWTIGDLDTHDGVCRELAAAIPAIVVAVDYRLAPEHRFPAAADDALAATRWVSAHASELGADPARLAVGGDSAGGNLAAVVALRARDDGGPRIAFQLLVYPAVDSDFDRASYRENGDGYLLTTALMHWFWNHYEPDVSKRTHPWASPLRASTLRGLPPALVITAEYDPLRDEGEAYAAQLNEAGVPAEVRRFDGMIHAFFQMSPVFEQGAVAIRHAARALGRALGTA